MIIFFEFLKKIYQLRIFCLYSQLYRQQYSIKNLSWGCYGIEIIQSLNHMENFCILLDSVIHIFVEIHFKFEFVRNFFSKSNRFDFCFLKVFELEKSIQIQVGLFQIRICLSFVFQTYLDFIRNLQISLSWLTFLWRLFSNSNFFVLFIKVEYVWILFNKRPN